MNNNKFATTGQVYGVSKMLAYLFIGQNGLEKFHYKKLVSRFQAVIYNAHPENEVPRAEINKIFETKSLDTPYVKGIIKNLKTDGLGLKPAKGKEKIQRSSKAPQLTRLALL